MANLLNQLDAIPVSFGGAAISGEGGGYGFGAISEMDSTALLDYSYELGIRIFDTAPIYGFGMSERRLGKALKSVREKVFFVSKSGVSWHPETSRVDMTNDPKTTQSMLEQSLRNLDCDYIDLYMIHWPDKRVDIRKPMEVLAKAKQSGKIRHIGLCNTNINDLERSSEIEKIEVVQSQFNLFERDVKDDLFEYLSSKQISFMSWGTFDKGILTNRVDEQRKFDACDARSWAPWWKKSDKNIKIKKMKELIPFLNKNGITPVEMALGHNLHYQEVSTVICGMRSCKQVEEVVSAIKRIPSKEIIAKALEIINSEVKSN